MIYGIATAPGSEIGAGGGGGTGELGSPFASFDFTTATYTIAGTGVSFGSNFMDSTNAATGPLVDSNGMGHDALGFVSTEGVDLQGALAALVVGTGAPFTIYAETQIPSATALELFTIENDTTGNDFLVEVKNNSGTSRVRFFDNNGPDLLVFSGVAALDVPAKLAVRIDAADYRATVDGDTVQVGTMGSPVSFADGVVRLLFSAVGAPTLRRFEIYGDLSDADLITLTT